MRKTGRAKQRKDKSWGKEVLLNLRLILSKLKRNSFFYTTSRENGGEAETSRKSAEIIIPCDKLRRRLLKQCSTRGTQDIPRTLLMKLTVALEPITTAPCGGKSYILRMSPQRPWIQTITFSSKHLPSFNGGHLFYS